MDQLRDTQINAIVINENDNVAVATKQLKKNEEGVFKLGNDVRKITITSEVPIYHKFAIKALSEGTKIVKYGSNVGIATSVIELGSHVHVHNITSINKG